jgi:Ca2+-binding RTX toxin-like protein
MFKSLRRPTRSRNTNRLRRAAVAPAIEPLEQRRLLALSYTCDPYIGLLQIFGDGDSDQFAIEDGEESGTFIITDLQTGAEYLIYCPANLIDIDTGPGDDAIMVYTPTPTVITPGPGVDGVFLGDNAGNTTVVCDDPSVDVIQPGPAGPNNIIAGPEDTIMGRAGNDNIQIRSNGSAGGGEIHGGGGTDTIDFSDATGPVHLSNDGVADDGIAGELFNLDTDVEILIGGDYNDTLTGYTGNDLLIGNDGDDSILGWDGNDTLDGGAGADTMRGGMGSDTVTYASRTNGVVANLDGLKNDGEPGELDVIDPTIEHLIGGAGNDQLTGKANANVLTGNAGADTLYGAAGDDTLYGNDGADYLYGDDGNDSLFGGANNPGTTDILHGGNGNDSLDGQGGQDSLFGDAGADTLRGGAGDGAADWFVANDGEHDLLYMGSGDNGVWDTIDDTLPG